MSTGRFYKLIIYVLCFAMMLTGCSSPDVAQPQPGDFFVNVRSDSTLVYNSRGEFSLNVISDNADFAEEISPDNIVVCYSVINDSVLPEIDSQKGIPLTESEYRVCNITPTNVTRNSSRSVTVEFTDKDFDANRPSDYILIFDRKCSAANKYLCAGVTVRYPTYALVSDVSQITSGSAPVSIRLTLDNSTFSEEITEQDIVLSGSFGNSSINNFERIGDNTISFTLSDINSDYVKNGKITVKGSAVTDSCQDVFTTIKVISPAAYFSADTLKTTGNRVSFTINLQDCQFNDELLPEMLTASQSGVSVDELRRVSQSQAEVTLEVSGVNTEDIPDIVSGLEFSLSPSALNIPTPVDFTANVGETDVRVSILSVSRGNDTISAELELDALNGTFNSVSRSGLAFTGDFANADITSITSKDDSVTVQIEIPDTEEKTELVGSAALRTGSVSDRWGKNGFAAAVPLYYSFDGSPTNTEGFSGNYDSLQPLLEVISDSLSDNSSLTDVMNGQPDTDDTYQSYIAAAERNAYIEPILRQSEQCIAAGHLSQTGEHINKDRAQLVSFMSDLQALWAASRRAANYLTELYKTERSIDNCTDDAQLAALQSQREEYLAVIKAVGGSTVKGMSYYELLERVIDKYYGADGSKGALKCFDNLTDCMYNWQSQTQKRKNEFRYAVASVIIQSACIAGMSSDDDTQLISSLSSRLKALSEYLTPDDTDTDGEEMPCNTLGKSLTLEHLAFPTLSGELTYDEITQLINMLPEDITLRDELEQVGFDISSVRYLVCSDSPISSNLSVSSLSDGSGASLLFTISSKATVYDLIRNEFINEFEYENITTLLTADENEDGLAVTQTVNTALKLYSVK